MTPSIPQPSPPPPCPPPPSTPPTPPPPSSPPAKSAPSQLPALRRPRLLSRFLAPRTIPRHTSSAAFRGYLMRHSSPSRRRIHLANSSHTLEFIATPPGGDCGFIAIAWSLLIHGLLPPTQSSGQIIRHRLSKHVHDEREFYAGRLREWDLGGGDEAGSVNQFVREVRQGGLNGHWLGQLWGGMEIWAVGRCFGVGIELYAWDVGEQKVRRYWRVCEGKDVVSLFFSGDAAGGHFDLLVSKGGVSRRDPRALVR